MYDIFFDINDMHQPVEETKASQNDGFSWDVEQLDFDFVEKVAKNKDGCTCTKCNEFFPYAEPNQSNGTLICYSCRKYG